ncbi:MAG: hypothetical protein U5J83_08135 [Bryobacterales bacterium]|nr:hypothetical protein [Bryobacterales bacterium]
MLHCTFRVLLTLVLLQAMDAGDSAAPSAESVRPAGTLELVGFVHDDRALNRAHDVEIQGDFAFVAGKGGSLAIVNIADPSAPKIVSALADPVEYEDAETVLPMGNVLFLGTRDFFAIDISDPATPRVSEDRSPSADRFHQRHGAVRPLCIDGKQIRLHRHLRCRQSG